MSAGVQDALLEQGFRLTGSESGIAPKTWFPPVRSEWAASFVTGVEAVQEYQKLGQEYMTRGKQYASQAEAYIGQADKVLSEYGATVPKWMRETAAKGALWVPMVLEARALFATVEAATNQAFETVSRKVKEAAKYAPLVMKGVDFGTEILALVNSQDLSAAKIVSAVTGLLNNAVNIVEQVGKAFKLDFGAAKNIFATIPWVGTVTKVVMEVLQLLIGKGQGTDPALVLANVKIADMWAREQVLDRCKLKLQQASGPVPSDVDDKLSPADYFRPISYWIQSSVDWWTGTGAYTGKIPGQQSWSIFGDRGLDHAPSMPPPPMTPMWFYVALCGDVLPPMLRPTTCGVEQYEPGWLGSRNLRTAKDCYTAGVEYFQKRYKNPNFGIPRATRHVMWKLIQSILASVQSPDTFTPDVTDQGRSFFLTLQQICTNEILSGRINTEFVRWLNNDLLMRHGWVYGDWRGSGGALLEEGPIQAPRVVEGIHYGIPTKGTAGRKGGEYYGVATCRDFSTEDAESLRLDTKWFKQIAQFSKRSLSPIDGQKFYDQTLNNGEGGWIFDMTAMERLRRVPRRGYLYLNPKIVKSVEAAIKKDKDRFAEGSIPWVALVAAGGAGFGFWMYARNRARGGKT